jgi:low affinity Fe/Cu permease
MSGFRDIYCVAVTITSPPVALWPGESSLRRNVTAQQRLSLQMAEQNEKSWFEKLGCKLSEWVAGIAAHPYAQIAFILVCLGWFVIGWNVNILTAALSILAITLTQMVLNNQNEREVEAHRRDVAMHAKLDELISATRRARNDLVAAEELDEDEIVQLKDEVKEAIEETADAVKRG